MKLRSEHGPLALSECIVIHGVWEDLLIAIPLSVTSNVCRYVTLHLQVSDTISAAEALLGDLAGFESFLNEGRSLGEELREYQREQVDQWSRQTLAAIDHPSESLR